MANGADRPANACRHLAGSMRHHFTPTPVLFERTMIGVFIYSNPSEAHFLNYNMALVALPPRIQVYLQLCRFFRGLFRVWEIPSFPLLQDPKPVLKRLGKHSAAFHPDTMQ